METISQDIFDLICFNLQRQSLIEFSCSCKKINSMFDSESLWFLLLNRDYPKKSLVQGFSFYEGYLQEYINCNRITYVSITGNSDYDDVKYISRKFLTYNECFEDLWDKNLSRSKIIKRYFTLKPQLVRLVKKFIHEVILSIVNSDNPMKELMLYNYEINEFTYDEDISSYEELLDLMNDYCDELQKYKDCLYKKLITSSIEKPYSYGGYYGIVGWYIYKIEKRTGIN